MIKSILPVFIFFLSVNLYGGICPMDTTKERPKKASKIITTPPIPATEIAKNCAKIESVINIIDEAISVGAPTYNEGNHAACYMIYMGAAYRIIYLYGTKCKQVKNILETAIERTQGNYTITEKAWIMRMAFDEIEGVPTQTSK